MVFSLRSLVHGFSNFNAIAQRERTKWPAAITSVKKSYEEPPAGITHIFIAAPLSHNLTTW